MAISKTLPEVLRFGYVFLADAESQGGLIGAGAKINAIATQMFEITPYTMVVKLGGQTEVQIAASGQTSMLPQPYVAPVWQPAEPASGNVPLQTSYVIGSTMPILDDWLMPQTPQIKDLGAAAPYRPALAGNSRFALREGLPNRFKTERLPLSTDDLVQCISKRIDLNAQVLNAGLRKNLKITRKTIDDIFGKSDETVDSIQARLSNTDIARRAQKVLFDAEFIDPRDLHPLLLARLQSEYNEHQGMDLSEQELARALNLILATFPHLVRDASRACAARFKEVFDAEMLPRFIEAPDCINRSRLNVYGVVPQDLNDTEHRFAQMLDADTGGLLAWWHRNEPRKPWSIGIVLPGGGRYFPDFIVGLNGHHQGDSVLLVEIKGGHIINYEDTLEKIDAEHKQYGKPLMLTAQDDGRFWIMRYIESTRKIEQDQVFRVENMGQY
jgi:type III restriction enzyme